MKVYSRLIIVVIILSGIERMPIIGFRVIDVGIPNMNRTLVGVPLLGKA